MHRLAFPLLAALMCASAAFIAATAGQLPATVASHFGGHGANGWMARNVYLLWMLGLSVLVPGLLVVLIAVLPRIVPRLVDLPHKDYWMADARRGETISSLFAFACCLAALMTVFAAGLHYVILNANATTLPALSASLLAALVALLLVGAVTWTGALYARFRTMS